MAHSVPGFREILVDQRNRDGALTLTGATYDIKHERLSSSANKIE